MQILLLLLRWLLILAIGGCGAAMLALSGTVLYLLPDLPDAQELKAIELQTPLRIYSSDEKLIAEFGEKRRRPMAFEDIPKPMIEAFLAAEDANFFEHGGVDVYGLGRAVKELVLAGQIRSGGSTITMQVAKNFFLSNERKFIRKFKEILLALQIERELSKQEILELYLNKIFLGNRAYGIGAAAEVYYGKPVAELNLSQIAMIAGLPKAPSAYNPIANSTRAKSRRDWILNRMASRELNFISLVDRDQAIDTPISAQYHGQTTDLDAPYFAELVRQEMYEQFGDDIYQRGFSVYTTIDSKLQNAAEKAVMDGLIAYTERHGYRGPEQRLKVDLTTAKTDAELPNNMDWLDQVVAPAKVGPLIAGLVLTATPNKAEVLLADGEEIELQLNGMAWAREYIEVNKRGAKPLAVDTVLSAGDIIRVRHIKQRNDTDEGNPADTWHLSQLPKTQASMTSIRPQDGAILSIVGGLDFKMSKFNRAVQGQRQAGSCFKPFVYGAALEQGFTAASIVNDAPVVYDDVTQDEAWRPRNAGDKFKGPIRLRQALYESRNLVSIRVAQQIGVKKIIDFASRTGLAKNRLSPNLSIALGTPQFTTAEMAQAYSTFANGGYRIVPYFIERVVDNHDKDVFVANPARVCPTDDKAKAGVAAVGKIKTSKNNKSCDDDTARAEQVLEPTDLFILNSMMQDVINRGTGRLARSLDRTDIAGKTGTTNNEVDAWFCGYHPQLSTSVWVGFDNPAPLGRNEYGGKAALPIWIDYMQQALPGLSKASIIEPEGITSIKIDPKTGTPASRGQRNTIFEYFKTDTMPSEWNDSGQAPSNMPTESETIESIF